MQVDLRTYVRRVNQKLATGKTVFEVFSRCYETVFKRPCMSDRVALDAEDWVRTVRAGIGPIVPKYVSWYFEHEDERRQYMIANTMVCSVAEGGDPWSRRR
jgi:hypothetical protein